MLLLEEAELADADERRRRRAELGPLDAAALPDDVETLRWMLLAERQTTAAARAEVDSLSGQLQQARAGLVEKVLDIEKLEAQLAPLRRLAFGRSSEKLDVALGRKNYLLAGSDRGGERAAAAYPLIESAALNDLNPQAYLTDVIARIASHPARRLADLLPWTWTP